MNEAQFKQKLQEQGYGEAQSSRLGAGSLTDVAVPAPDVGQSLWQGQFYPTREVDRHLRGNIGDGESITGDVGAFRQAPIERLEKLCEAVASARREFRDLRDVYRTRGRPVGETLGGITKRFTRGKNAVDLAAMLPHGDDAAVRRIDP